MKRIEALIKACFFIILAYIVIYSDADTIINMVFGAAYLMAGSFYIYKYFNTK